MFYQEEEPVQEIEMKPVILHSLEDISDNSEISYIVDTPVLREFESVIGDFAFNCAIVEKIKKMIHANERDIMNFELQTEPLPSEHTD